MYRKNLLTCWLALLLMVTLIGLAQAQAPPDAGMLRQQIEQGLPPAMPLPAPLERPAPPPAMQALPGELTVQEFRFVGNTLITTAQLQPAVAVWLNRPLNFNQLQSAAAAVAQVYRDAGWIVRAYLPRQEIVDGVVTIQIVEALFGSVHFESDGVRRISNAKLQKWLEQTQTPGQPLNASALDRSLLLLSDLPGVAVTGSLKEGARQGESDVVLKVADKPLLAGDAALDNTGSQSTGTVRLGTNLALNSPLGFADQGNLNFLHTEGSDYLRLAYSFPLGYDGMRVGINASEMRYRLIGANFAALNGFGSSGTWGLDLNYPVYRTRLSNVYVNATLDHKTFDNSTGGSTTTRYQMNTATAGISANLTDTLGSGASNNASLTLTSGYVNLDGSPNQAADAASTQTAGQFSKLRYAASRLQTLSDQLAFNANLTGQFAAKNLDSGERFYLGGSGGVRAYPASEAGGSEGMMVNLELRWQLAPGLQVTGFYDWGSVTVNRNNDFAGAAILNQLSLQGGGLALGMQAPGGINVKLVWARRVGDNPNPASTGNDQDGTLVRDRIWLNATLPF